MKRKETTEEINKKLKWHFKAEKVHDFAWAADPFLFMNKLNLIMELYFIFYIKTIHLNENWKLYNHMLLNVLSYEQKLW